MRVMQYTGAQVLGGLLSHLDLLCRGLLQAGDQVHAVLAPEAALDPLARGLTQSGADVDRCRAGGKSDLIGLTALGRLVRRSRPDVVHVHLGSPVESMPALLALRRAGARHLVTTEHLPTFAPRRRVYSRTAKRLVGRVLDAVITVSAADARYLAREFAVPDCLLHVVPNGIADFETLPERAAARDALGLDGRARVIGYVGSLEERKGVPELVEAVAALDHPDVILLLAGDGPLEPRLRRYAAELPWLRLAGRLEDVRPLLAALDIFVLPSHHEAMPLALLEAMWSGLPIVATPVGGVPEAVTDGASALLVKPGDVEGLGAALRRLAEDAGLARRLGAAARAAAEERFSAARMVAGVQAVYRDVTGGR